MTASIIKDYAQLAEVRDRCKIAGKNQKIGLCHGVFDVFHHGHLQYLKFAERNCDILIVSITSDENVNKGLGRPYFPDWKRAEILSELACVDAVFINNAITAIPVISNLKPDLYIKGADYALVDDDLTGNMALEVNAVESYGGLVKFSDTSLSSSSFLLNRYFNVLSSEQNAYIDRQIPSGYLDSLRDTLDQARGLRCVVLGEPITDEFTDVEILGVAAKHNSVSVSVGETSKHFGGATAVAQHLANFGASVIQIWPNRPKDSGIDKPVCDQATIHFSELQLESDWEIPVKRRYENKRARLFETSNLDRYKAISDRDSDNLFVEISRLMGDADLLVVADFGHGLISETLAARLVDTFGERLVANVQANSGNFGFNLVSKYAGAKTLVCDEREARLCLRDLEEDRYALAEKLAACFGYREVWVTLGSDGSVGSTSHDRNSERVSVCPSFCDRVIDTIGAGDAFFSCCAVLSSCNSLPLSGISFASNIYAGMAASIRGNERVPDIQTFLKSIKSMMIR